jgi:hypothetical protein
MRNIIALILLTACSNTAITAGHDPLVAGSAGKIDIVGESGAAGSANAGSAGSAGASETSSAGEATGAGAGGETAGEGGSVAAAGEGSGGAAESSGGLSGIGGSGIGGSTVIEGFGGEIGIGGNTETGGTTEAGVGGFAQGGTPEGSGGTSEEGGTTNVGGATACVPLTCETYALNQQSQQINNNFLMAQAAEAMASGDLTNLKYKTCGSIEDGCGAVIVCDECVVPEYCGGKSYQWNNTTGILDEIRVVGICGGNCKADFTTVPDCIEVICAEGLLANSWFSQTTDMQPYNEESTWDIVRTDNGERVPQFSSCPNVLNEFGGMTYSYCCSE